MGLMPCKITSFTAMVRRGLCCISGAVFVPRLRGRPHGLFFVHPHHFNGDVFLDVLCSCCSYARDRGFRDLFKGL